MKLKSLFFKNRNFLNFYMMFEKKKKIFKLTLIQFLKNSLKRVNKHFENISETERLIYYNYKNIFRETSFSFYNSRCFFTNRGRSVYKDFKMSRLVFRKYVTQGFIPGIRKSIW
jgi:ribosomal protein S14